MKEPETTRAHGVSVITRQEILRRLGDPTLTLVDALPREAFEESRIATSINLPVSEVKRSAGRLLPDPNAEIAVYCGGPT